MKRKIDKTKLSYNQRIRRQSLTGSISSYNKALEKCKDNEFYYSIVDMHYDHTMKQQVELLNKEGHLYYDRKGSFNENNMIPIIHYKDDKSKDWTEYMLQNKHLLEYFKKDK